jgi:hypothetical protein
MKYGLHFSSKDNAKIFGSTMLEALGVSNARQNMLCHVFIPTLTLLTKKVVISLPFLTLSY